MLADQDDEANFEDLRIVHQEITKEDGETEIVPIAMKIINSKVQPKKANRIQPTKKQEFLKKRNETDEGVNSDEESIEVMMDENGNPVVVSTSQRKQKGKLAEKVPTGGVEG